MAGRLSSLWSSPLWIVLISVAVAVPMALWLGRPGALPPPAATLDSPRLSDLERRLEALEQRLALADALHVAASDGDKLEPRVPVRADESVRVPDFAMVVQRLDAIEQRVLGRAVARERPAEDAPDPALVIVDPAASVEDKIEAHHRLRRVPDSYTSAMVQTLISIGQTAADAEQRAHVWAYFDGASHIPVLVPHLLHALVYDPSDHVRDEASETLGNYADDPAVLQAIRHAADNDPASRVRKKALRTLREVQRTAQRR